MAPESSDNRVNNNNSNTNNNSNNNAANSVCRFFGRGQCMTFHLILICFCFLKTFFEINFSILKIFQLES
jgi:hypothetical protein